MAKQFAATAASTSAKFVVNTGDNFYYYGVTGVDDTQWDTDFESVYNQASLTSVKWYGVLGNHDYGLDPTAQTQYVSKANPEFNRWVLPSRYFTKRIALDGANAGAGAPLRFWGPAVAASPQQARQTAGRRQLASLERELSDELAGHDQRQAALRSFAVDGLTEEEQLQMAITESQSMAQPPVPAEDDTANDAALAQALKDSSGAIDVRSQTLVADGPLARVYLIAQAARNPLDLETDIQRPLL